MVFLTLRNRSAAFVAVSMRAMRRPYIARRASRSSGVTPPVRGSGHTCTLVESVWPL